MNCYVGISTHFSGQSNKVLAESTRNWFDSQILKLGSRKGSIFMIKNSLVERHHVPHSAIRSHIIPLLIEDPISAVHIAQRTCDSAKTTPSVIEEILPPSLATAQQQ